MSYIKKTIKKYEMINEELYEYTHINGLNIFIIPKKEYKKFYVCLNVNFGAMNNEFDVNNIKVMNPLGVAHFIEHKIFATPDNNDASNIFESMGLEINAYTSYSNTAYYFSGNENLLLGIKSLFDFIFCPFFTEQNIRNEKKIIKQEIKMFLDNPSSILTNGLKRNMFNSEVLHSDISGSIKSVNQINKDILYNTYNTFYNPSNMDLIIIGDLNIKDSLEKLDNYLNMVKTDFNKNIFLSKLYEDEKVIRKRGYKKMEVNIPKVAVGIKLPYLYLNNDEYIKYEFVFNVILKYSIGFGTDFYQKMLDDKIIDSHYSYVFYLENGIGYMKVYGDTFMYNEFIERIKQKLLSKDIFEINENDLLLSKKVIMSYYIRTFDDPENIGEKFVDYLTQNANFFNEFKIIKEIDINYIKEFSKFFTEESFTSFVILPKSKKFQ